ncbi:hypothetical protein SAMN02927895_02005 [Belnapia rosea]|nr:hypothetical protein SAMN02927895_02005 [Belnapia rosea]
MPLRPRGGRGKGRAGSRQGARHRQRCGPGLRQVLGFAAPEPGLWHIVAGRVRSLRWGWSFNRSLDRWQGCRPWRLFLQDRHRHHRVRRRFGLGQGCLLLLGNGLGQSGRGTADRGWVWRWRYPAHRSRRAGRHGQGQSRHARTGHPGYGQRPGRERSGGAVHAGGLGRRAHGLAGAEQQGGEILRASLLCAGRCGHRRARRHRREACGGVHGDPVQRHRAAAKHGPARGHAAPASPAPAPAKPAGRTAEAAGQDAPGLGTDPAIPARRGPATASAAVPSPA